MLLEQPCLKAKSYGKLMLFGVKNYLNPCFIISSILLSFSRFAPRSFIQMHFGTSLSLKYHDLIVWEIRRNKHGMSPRTPKGNRGARMSRKEVCKHMPFDCFGVRIQYHIVGAVLPIVPFDHLELGDLGYTWENFPLRSTLLNRLDIVA